MANQFSAKVRFDAVAWRALDRESGAVLTVVDDWKSEATWSVVVPCSPPSRVRVVFRERGTARDGRSARGKARRALARYLKAKTDQH